MTGAIAHLDCRWENTWQESDPRKVGVRSITEWFTLPQRHGRLRGDVEGSAGRGFSAHIKAVGGRLHEDLGEFGDLFAARTAVKDWLVRNNAYPSPAANHHIWSVVSSGDAARAGGVAEVHQCQHESCGKFRIIAADADEDKLYTYRQLTAVYPGIEWD